MLSVLAAAVLLAAGGSDASPAHDYSQAGAQLSLLEQSKDVKSQLSDSASKAAGLRRATRIRARPGCTLDREPFVRFRWSPARDRGRAQRVDYTEFFRGFRAGKYHKSRKLAPGKRRWRTRKIETGLDYNWRVMTRRTRRWVRSPVRSFDAPVCVGSSAARP
jgi:hypothetical protein